VLAHALAAGLSLNRIGFGLAYLVAPARAGKGWIGRAARDPATQVFARGHGARDIALGAGALGTLVRGQPRHARDWMCAQALADGADLVATLASRPRLPSSGFRFALLMAGGSTAVAIASAGLLHAASRGCSRGGSGVSTGQPPSEISLPAARGRRSTRPR
jgi:hypothetical protein